MASPRSDKFDISMTCEVCGEAIVYVVTQNPHDDIDFAIRPCSGCLSEAYDDGFKDGAE